MANLAAVLVSQVHRDADAMDGRGEAGEEQLLFRCSEDVVEAGNDSLFAGSEAGAVNVGGVLQQAKHALLAEIGERLQIEGVAVGRGQVDLEVAGVEDDADRGVDGQRDAIDQRVRDADRQDAEGPEREAAAGNKLDQLGVVEQAMLVELAFNVGQGELGAVNGHVELGEDPGKAADVVLVAVGQHDAADLFAVLDEEADVGNDDVDAQ